MIFLKLFLTFFEIGAVSFGGGYGMLALMRELVVGNGWLTEEEMLRFIAVSESTPGPVAINMATFVGSSQGGFFGSVCATLGVVLPSFIIILLVAAVLKHFLNRPGVQAFLSGVRPVAVALILGAGITMALKVFFSVSTLASTPSVDWRPFAILAILLAVHFGWKALRKKKPAPVLMILLSAALGIVFYLE